MDEPRGTEPSNPLVHHETSDVDIKAVVVFAVVLLVVGVLVHFGVALMLKGLGAERDRELETPLTRVAGAGRELPPQPRLQPFPPQQQAFPGSDPAIVPHTPVYDMETMRKEEDAALSSYGWIDQQRGVVHIPITRAIDVMAGRGFPVRAEAAKMAAAASQASAVSGGSNSGQMIGRSAP